MLRISSSERSATCSRAWGLIHVSFAQPYMLDDIQNTTQYIANAIDLLNQVTCRPFPVMGWDLGGLATQFTFTFYPSTRRKVSHFFGLAADFRGTTAICE